MQNNRWCALINQNTMPNILQQHGGLSLTSSHVIKVKSQLHVVTHRVNIFWAQYTKNTQAWKVAVDKYSSIGQFLG